MRSAKKLLRTEMKRILNALTDDAKEAQSAAVTARLLGDEDYKVRRGGVRPRAGLGGL